MGNFIHHTVESKGVSRGGTISCSLANVSGFAQLHHVVDKDKAKDEGTGPKNSIITDNRKHFSVLAKKHIEEHVPDHFTPELHNNLHI